MSTSMSNLTSVIILHIYNLIQCKAKRGKDCIEVLLNGGSIVKVNSKGNTQNADSSIVQNVFYFIIPCDHHASAAVALMFVWTIDKVLFDEHTVTIVTSWSVGYFAFESTSWQQRTGKWDEPVLVSSYDAICAVMVVGARGHNHQILQIVIAASGFKWFLMASIALPPSAQALITSEKVCVNIGLAHRRVTHENKIIFQACIRGHVRSPSQSILSKPFIVIPTYLRTIGFLHIKVHSFAHIF